MEGAFSSEEKKKNQQEKEKNWVLIQIKGLSAWVNSYLQSANISLIQDLQKDLQDGVKLNQFLAVVSGKKLSFDLTPQMKIHKIQNLSLAINFVQETLGVRLIGISAEDIERGDIKLILGLIYSIFRTIRISKIATQIGETDKKKSEGQQLIAWMNTLVEKDPYELKLESFKDEPFRNGKAFGALLHSYNNELLDYENLGDNAEENLKNIFAVFEQKLGIPQLLDVNEVVNGTVDERAITLYSSLIYHAHASQEERRKLEEGQQKKEEELNKEKLSRKQLEEKHHQLINEKEQLELEKQELERTKAEELEKRKKAEEEAKRLEEERIRLEQEKLLQTQESERILQEKEKIEKERALEEEMRKALEEEKKKLEEERENLRREKEELEKEKKKEIELREGAETLNQQITLEKENFKKDLEKEEELRRKAEEEKKKLLQEVQNGLSNQINLRDQMLFLYQCLMDERYQDIEDFLLNQKKNLSNTSSEVSESNSEGNTTNDVNNSSESSESSESAKRNRVNRVTKIGEENESKEANENSTSGDEGGQSAQRNRRERTINSINEEPKIDITSDEGIENERKRNLQNQRRLQKELEDLQERMKKEIQRRRKDALKLSQYEEKLKQYESKAIEQNEANRALDILKKNLTEHVEDLKAWVELSEFDLDSEKKEKYDPSLIRANLKEKKFDEQIDFLAEQLQGENESMRRILQVKESKKQLYDNYSDKQGWLHMKTEEKAPWKSQWFVLKSNELSYYASEEKGDRAGGVTIDSNCSVSSEKVESLDGQEIYPIKITIKEGTDFYIAPTTKKSKKEWSCVLKGKIIFSNYMNQIEQSKTRPDIRLSNVLFATVDLGSIRMDNAPISKFTVWGISKALRNFEDLNVVTFSSSEFTDELASIFSPALKKSFVRTLDFSDNLLTSEGAKLIAESLKENRSIESIDFSSNSIEDAASESIASLISYKKISTINFENNKFTSEGAKKILESLSNHPKWTTLQFSGNIIGDEGCKFVAELISKNETISELQLARNRIGDEGVKELCLALKDNTNITQIDLSGNLLTQTSITYINEMLKENKTLKHLNLSENPQIGGKGIFSNEAFSLSSFSLLRVL